MLGHIVSQSFASKSFIAAACVAALFLLEHLPAVAQELPAPQKPPARRVVLRISDAALNSFLGNHDVDRQIDVSETILGTAVSGKLRLVGKPRVTFVDRPERGVLNLRFDGTTYSRTTGYNGPAIIYNRTITTFSATRQIVLEPGKGIYGLPPQVSAHTQVFLEGIDSTRGGLVGRIVRRRATKIEAARHDEATEIARRKAEKRIEAGFVRHTEQRLAQLNSLANHRASAATLPGSTKTEAPKFSFSTTPDCLQIVATFGPGNSTDDLPSFGAGNLAAAPVEIWIHDSLVSDWMVTALSSLNSQAGTGMWLEPLARSALLASKVDSKNLGALLTQQQIRVRQVNDWKVVALENPTDRSRATPPPTAVVVRTPVLPTVSDGPPAPTSVIVAAKLSQTGPRIWTSGEYTAHAEFLELDGKDVRLRRVTGIITRIPLEKLSALDQQWIANHLGSR